MRKEQLEQQKETQTNEKEPPPTQLEQPPEPSEKAKEWAEKNSWFGKDKIMTAAAYTVHEELLSRGFDPESDDYYTEINKSMRDNFPQKLVEDKQPIQTVASAGRKQQGRRKVTLTRSQVAIARKLGVPLEEYAKFVKE